MALIDQLPHQHSHEGNVPDKIPAIESVRTVSDAFRFLGDPVRLQIFWILCHCTECVTDIAAMVGMSTPAVSHHLRILKSGGLITSKRSGKEMFYHAAETPLVESLHVTMEKIMQITCPGTH